MSRNPVSATVVANTRLTPAMRRIVLTAPDLARLKAPAGALGPYLKLHLQAPDGRPLVRTYSVRRHDADRNELQVDMLVHAGDAVGAAFAVRARPGDGILVGGPGHIPAEPCAAYLLAGDQTALPAIAHILEHLPAGRRARAFVEAPGPAEEQPLAAFAEVTWLHRREGEPSRLAQALRSGWPKTEPDLLVWAGAEAEIARAIRQEARRARGIPPARCQVLNYWKRGRPEGGFSYVD